MSRRATLTLTIAVLAWLAAGCAVDIGTARPGDDVAALYGVTDDAVVVGESGTTATHTSTGFVSFRLGLVHALLPFRNDAVSGARAINNHGQIVGWTTLPPDSSGHRPTVGATWFGGEPGSTITLGGDAIANDVNDAGDVVGHSETSPSGPRRGFVRSGSPAQDTTLSTLGGSESAAEGVNQAGQIVGSATTTDGRAHAVRWEPATFKIVDLTPNATEARATDINGSGQVVGSFKTAAGQTHAALWRPGTSEPVDLGTLGGSDSFAEAINDHGVIVGRAQNTAGVFRAFRWDPATGVLSELGVDRTGSAAALAVNNNGVVVGTTERPGGGSIAVRFFP